MVNHQFQTEAWEVLNKLAASSYQVDILLYRNQRLILFMPTQKVPTRFKHVHAKFYVLKDDETRLKYGWHSYYHFGDGGPVGAWELYRILESFLQCGPLDPTHAPANAHIWIGTLELDICTRPGIPEDLLGPPNIPSEDQSAWPSFAHLGGRLLSLKRVTGTHYKMHPDYLVVYLRLLFEVLLFNPSGRLIYERVRVVMLLFDGRRLHEWNLDELLKKMPSEDERAQWRDSVLALRSQMKVWH